MRNIVAVAAIAIAFGLLGTPLLAPAATAAPAGAGAIGTASTSASILHQVPCAVRRVCNRRGCWARRVCW